MYKTVERPDLPARLNTEVVVWYGREGCGLGGVLTGVSDAGLELTNHHYGVKTWEWDEVVKVDVDEPGDPRECLNYGHDGSGCEGPVEMWQTGGSSMRAWPRCTKHGEARLRRREESLERYADSDVPPAGFREDDIGERWSDDY
jgi:hypothetical protein